MTATGDDPVTPPLEDVLRALDEAVRRVAVLRRRLWAELETVECAMDDALNAVHAARRAQER